MNTQVKILRTHSVGRYTATVVAVVLAVTLALVSPGSPGARTSVAAAPTATHVALPSRAAAAPAPLSRAKTALTLAVSQLRKGRPRKAAAALGTLTRQTVRAHAAAVGLIGKPPADPESDEPPGPGAVLAMMGFDHRVTTTLVPLLNRARRARVVDALRVALRRTHVRRNLMVAKVVGLPPEGAGDDYADGMSDTLSTFPREITLINGALTTYVLTPVGRIALTNARARVRTADALMNDAYGGGE